MAKAAPVRNGLVNLSPSENIPRLHPRKFDLLVPYTVSISFSDKHRGNARDQKLCSLRRRNESNVFVFRGRCSCVCFDASVGGRPFLSLGSKPKEQSVRS